MIAALLMAALLQLMGPSSVRTPLFDLWQRITPHDLNDTPVRIVWIDDLSLRIHGTWPWPRQLMAELTNRIAKADARVIGFDVLFPERDRISPAEIVQTYPKLTASSAADIRAQPSTDLGFSDVIRMAPVVLGRAGVDAAPDKTPAALAVEAQFSKPLPEGVRSWPRALANIPEIDDVGLGHGLLNGDRDEDGIVRQVPLVGRVAGTDTPGFALELVRIAEGVDIVAPVVRGGKLRALSLGHVRIPARKDGRMRLRFGRMPKRFTVSAADILDGTADMSVFRDKIVIIGLSGAGTADLVATPLARQGFGAEVQANAVDAMLTGQTLDRPDWAWLVEGLSTFLIVAVAVRYFPNMRPSRVNMVAATTIAALFGSSLLAFGGAGWLIDPVGPLLTGGAASLTMLLMLFSEARRQRLVLSAALDVERMSAERSAGELEAARKIQIGMLPQRDGLARFDPATDLDAVIEPARSVGGDFYDAIRIDPDHLCFLVGDVTGKGVPAALFMALSRALTKSVLLRDGNDLAAALSRLNEEIARDNREDMFVTMIIGLLDTRTGQLSLCNAGHENPWLVAADGRVIQLKPEGGPPLSVAPGLSYQAETVALSKGDAVVFVSDGITEAQNGAGDFFGNDRLAAELERIGTGGVLKDLNSALVQAVRKFEAGAEATDDLTALAFRYLGNR